MKEPGYDDGEEGDGTATEAAAARAEENRDRFFEESLQHSHQSTQPAIDINVPEPVRGWLQFFYRAFVNNNVYELASAYDSFSRLTDKFYAKTPWPQAEVVAPLINDDVNFIILYRELYYRHVYAKLQPTLEDRFASYDNYCDLFNFILNSEGPIDLDLPNQWAWDIIDEFVFQFQNYCSFRTRLARRVATNPDMSISEEVNIVRESVHIWSCYSVLNVLYSLIQKSNTNEILQAMKNGDDIQPVAGDYGTLNLYRMLGYFSIIGLLRVHCLLGDFTLAMKMLDNIELNKKALFARVTSAHYQTFYYVGFCYMMLNRYADATKTFSHILPILSRNKHNNRTTQYDQITKKGDQMFALLTICLSLCPTRIDDQLQTILRDKYGDQLARLSRSKADATATYSDLFLFAAPKFINPIAPDFETPQCRAEPVQHHIKVFLKDVEGWKIVQTLKSYVKLYSTMDTTKLAAFLDLEPDELQKQLFVYKQKSRQFKRIDGPLLAGKIVNTADIDFAMEMKIIHIAESRVGRKYADWFMRNTYKYYSIQDSIARDQHGPATMQGKQDAKDKTHYSSNRIAV